ncbi:MAG TPA: hypothetical protein PK954_12815, partial [Anaerolineales bacterium]|nr:hypothetical protein [Anaerolineales bacterium]
DGSGEDPNNERIEKALKATFRPEFLNRIDEIITFKPLEVEDVERIVDLQMREIQERVAESGLAIKLTDAARRWLAREGFDRAFGARPLRRALQKYIEGPLSTQMLRGEIKSIARLRRRNCAVGAVSSATRSRRRWRAPLPARRSNSSRTWPRNRRRAADRAPCRVPNHTGAPTSGAPV